MQALDQILIRNLKHCWGEDFSVLEHASNLYTVGERLNIQFLKQGSFIRLHFLPFLDNSLVRNNLNETFDDFGADTNSLEETSLGRIKPCATSRDPHIIGSQKTSTSGSFDSAFLDYFGYFCNWALAEDKPNIKLALLDERHDAF
jgi:hypothetical protein